MNLHRHTHTVILLFTLLIIGGCLLSCSGHRYASALDEAESLIEFRPDSAFKLLQAIPGDSITSASEKARYSLLMSMVLDKNLIDTTTFDVLQPAIDYYLKKGSPDQKLKTYYYLALIYQNQGDYDKALKSFIRALDLAPHVSDSLVLARTLVGEAHSYHGLYDFNNYSANHLRAADIYNRLNRKDLEFDCLMQALNGSLTIEERSLSDSIMSLIAVRFPSPEGNDYKRLQNNKLRYAIEFQQKEDVQKLIDSLGNNLIYNSTSLLDLARAYRKIERPDKALEILDHVKDSGEPYDTLKLLAVSVYTFKEKGDFENAFNTYWEFSKRNEAINRIKFNHTVKTIEEKNQIELKAQKDTDAKNRIIWICIVSIIILLMGATIAFLLLKITTVRRNLAQEKARLTEEENKNLKAEAELERQKAKIVTMENDNLKSKAELALQRAHSVELENEKLKAQFQIAQQSARIAQLENEKLQAEAKIARQSAKIAELENEKLKTEAELAQKKNQDAEKENATLKTESEKLSIRILELEKEQQSLIETINDADNELSEEVQHVIKERMELLNSMIAHHIKEKEPPEEAYKAWIKESTDDVVAFMKSNRLAFQVSHPQFIRYLEEHNLTTEEIEYACLYAIGLKGKEVGSYMKKRSHVNISSGIRKKLGIDQHETNLGIFLLKRIKDL